MLNNLFPKSSKLKKSFYPRELRIKNMSDNLLFGNYGIKTKKNNKLKKTRKFDELPKLNAKIQNDIKKFGLESLKKNANKILKKIGKIWIRPFPHYFITKKPLEVRMGNGKGNFYSWCVNLPKGFTILEFSIEEKSNINIFKIFKMLTSKIKGSIKFVKKNDLY